MSYEKYNQFEKLYYPLREPIGSLVFGKPCSRLRGEPMNPESRKVEKRDR